MWLIENFKLYMWLNYVSIRQHWSRLLGKCPPPKCPKPRPQSLISILLFPTEFSGINGTQLCRNTRQAVLQFKY